MDSLQNVLSYRHSRCSVRLYFDFECAVSSQLIRTQCNRVIIAIFVYQLLFIIIFGNRLAGTIAEEIPDIFLALLNLELCDSVTEYYQIMCYFEIRLQYFYTDVLFVYLGFFAPRSSAYS